MVEGLFLLSLLLTDPVGSIQNAIEQYQHVTSYQMRMRSTSDGKTEAMHYYFRKPGHVRMEFIQPFNGAVLIYDPTTRKVTLWPFGYHTFPAWTMSPESHLIQSATGHRVDRSDIGMLYQNVRALQEHGKAEIAPTKPAGENKILQIVIEGDSSFSVEAVHRYQLWLDQETGFPVKVSSYDISGQLIETVEMDELQINPALPENFFDK